MTENFPGPMAGKTALVTGGTGGIGRATAAGLAAPGAPSRHHRPGQGADPGRRHRDRPRVRQPGGGRVRRRHVLPGRGTRSRRRGPQRLPAAGCAGQQRGRVLGHQAPHRRRLERTFAASHLAAFLLTGLVLDRLKGSAPARIVTVSSNAQAAGRLNFDDLQGERSYSGQRAYSQSKLANIVFTYELARRLEGTGVTATALTPAWCARRSPPRTHPACRRS